ncbi:unnamed protein product [Vitrella brassicaformis CCMP3155]|uniref:LNR domain-containing protein n=2 Tax=Vitrella brassicaformis TaxID=1169539 RepID=A0A0G4ENC1_VITBC|nr:unnamed protein product [Vitrella brassicaformis CCMP3155]|eukprot:CEL99332.1 unnamed protein product [Vitrella brassicaformis CCMP3155]
MWLLVPELAAFLAFAVTPTGAKRRDGRRLQVAGASAEIPSACRCPANYWQDTVCDLECYNEECEWDGGDCQPGVFCSDLEPFCKWNETCVGGSVSAFGRCESLCTAIECSEDAHEICEVQHTPHSGEGDGVARCVCAEGFRRAEDGRCTTEPPSPPAAPINESDLTAAEYDQLLTWLGGPTRSLALLYKSVRDGYSFGDMLAKVESASGLAFVVRKDQYLHGCFVGDRLQLPTKAAAPTKFADAAAQVAPPEYREYDCPVWLFSLSGHFDKPTKIPLPPHVQGIRVASREGGVPLWWGKAKISVTHDEYIHFGWDDPKQSENLQSMLHFIPKDDTPPAYRGEVDEDGDAVLGGTLHFMADSLEILHVT